MLSSSSKHNPIWWRQDSARNSLDATFLNFGRRLPCRPKDVKKDTTSFFYFCVSTTTPGRLRVELAFVASDLLTSSAYRFSYSELAVPSRSLCLVWVSQIRTRATRGFAPRTRDSLKEFCEWAIRKVLGLVAAILDCNNPKFLVWPSVHFSVEIPEEPSVKKWTTHSTKLLF